MGFNCVLTLQCFTMEMFMVPLHCYLLITNKLILHNKMILLQYKAVLDGRWCWKDTFRVVK